MAAANFPSTSSIPASTRFSRMSTDMYGNILMDYAMYSILERSDVSLLFPDRMAQRVLFSKDCVSDSRLSDFFQGKITEDDNAAFRSQWLDEGLDQH